MTDTRRCALCPGRALGEGVYGDLCIPHADEAWREAEAADHFYDGDGDGDEDEKPYPAWLEEDYLLP